MIRIEVLLEKQSSEGDCGVSSLLMIIRYFKGNISKEYLRVITNTTSKGTTAYDLIKGAKEVGLNGIALTGNILDMEISNIPCITHIRNNNYNHFAVLTNIDYKNRIITLMDPDKGKRVLSIDEYNSIAFNNYIVFKPYKELVYESINNEVGKVLIKSIYDNKKTFLNILILSFIYIVFNLLLSYRFKLIYELSILFMSKNNLLVIFIILLILLLVKNSSLYFKNILIIFIKRNIDLIFTIKTYNKIMSLPYVYYHNKSTGEVISRLNETSELSNMVLNIILCILDILLIIFSIILIYLISPKLFIISLLFLILLIYIGIINIFINRKYIEKIKVVNASFNSRLYDFISNIELINNNKINNYTNNLFYKRLIDLINTNEKYNLNINTYTYISNLILDLVFVVISIYGAILVIDNSLSFSSYITVESILSYIFNPLNNIFSSILNICNIKVILNRLNDFYNIKDKEEIRECTKINKIELNNINYEISNKKIFSNYNLIINKNEKILLKGDNGSGKSTLLRIISGIIDNYEGNILINDIKSPNIDLYSSSIYISQNNNLLNMSVKDNIKLDSNIDNEKLETIIKICNINIPLDMMIEDNGFNISGGEKAKIIIARSLVKDYSIYLYDEIFNEIDKKGREDILKKVLSYLEDKIVIIVSHHKLNCKLINREIELVN